MKDFFLPLPCGSVQKNLQVFRPAGVYEMGLSIFPSAESIHKHGSKHRNAGCEHPSHQSKV